MDPTLDPKETQDTIQYFREKKGVAEAQATQMLGQVRQMGKGAELILILEKH